MMFTMWFGLGVAQILASATNYYSINPTYSLRCAQQWSLHGIGPQSNASVPSACPNADSQLGLRSNKAL